MSGVTYNEQLEALSSQFNSVLDDYKKYYIFSNKNPEYQDYVTGYSNAESTIQTINSKLLKILNDSETKLNKLLQDAFDINSQIEDEKKENEKLKTNLALMKSNTNGSKEMISNYKELYKEKYISNVTLFLGLFFSTYIIFKVYVKKT
jgi:peptidoglycan hydrolase CwlO-like protein